MGNPYVFISYKSEEVSFARELAGALAAVGIDSWAAFTHVRHNHGKEIPGAIKKASAVVILMSSRAYQSGEVLTEVGLARKFNRLQLPILLPGEVGPLELEGLSEEIRDEWLYGFVRTQYHPWGSADEAAAWIGDAIAEGPPSAPDPPEIVSAVHATRTTAEPVREPLALVSSLGLTYQLDGRHGLGQDLLRDGDPISTEDPGQIVLAPDGSVMATLNRKLEVAIWTLGSETSLPGPMLDDVLPPGTGAVRLLAIDRPIGQAIRIVASRGSTAYSVMEGRDGAWVSAELAAGDEEFVGGAAIIDDLLLVREGGETVWAGDHAKRPFSLRTVRGVDAAFGPDGRQYLAGWGSGTDGSPLVEAVVESEGGWERLHRGPGDRAGIVRVLHDAARQTPEPAAVAIAVQSAPDSVELLPIGV